jgi:hypothetical protein
LDNLVAFTRLVGYVQYFHPSDQANDTDWEQFTEQGIVAVERAVNSTELASILNKLFQPIAPTVLVFETDKPQRDLPDGLQPAMGTKSLQVLAWRHHGFGGGVKQDLYYSERIRMPVIQGIIPSDLPDPREPFYADLGSGVSALIPLALFADEDGTLPHQTLSIQTTATAPIYPPNEKTQYLATVVLVWNVLQHFYPYFDVVKTNWLSVLRDALAGADSARNEEQFVVVLREMVAQLHDGHGNVIVQSAPENLYRPPFGWDWVENQLVITFVGDEAKDQIHRGDKVIAIDGQPIDSVITFQERLISGATLQWIRFSALKNLLEGTLNSTITLTLQPTFGFPYQATFKRTVYLSFSDEYLFTEQRPSTISELKPGIWYVDLTRISDTQFNDNIPNLTKAAGIVFDMRGYPFNVGLEPIGHIIDHPVAWPQLKVPVIMYPDHQNMSFDPIVQTVEPISPHFPGKIAFITDGRAISYAESYMGIIESNKIADIVGEPTAGTNGNIIALTLFGRYSFVFTGMVVLKADGSQHHGVGIQPTVLVSRTLRGIREGRDELLESAIMIIKQQ